MCWRKIDKPTTLNIQYVPDVIAFLNIYGLKCNMSGNEKTSFVFDFCFHEQIGVESFK